MFIVVFEKGHCIPAVILEVWEKQTVFMSAMAQ